MSRKEFDSLLEGKRLLNDRAHNQEVTSSVGFCFFTEEPASAIHWLSGVVSTDMLVTLDFEEGHLTHSRGRYRDIENDDLSLPSDKIPCVWRDEYCTTSYSRDCARIVSYTDMYKDYGKIDNKALEALGGIGLADLLRLIFEQ